MIDLASYGFRVVARAPSVEKKEASYEGISEEIRNVVPKEVEKLWPNFQFEVKPRVWTMRFGNGTATQTDVTCSAFVVNNAVDTVTLTVTACQRGPKLTLDVYTTALGARVIRNRVDRGRPQRQVAIHRSMSLSAANRAQTTQGQVGNDVKKMIADAGAELKASIKKAIETSGKDLKEAEEKGTNPSHISKCKTFHSLYKAMEPLV